jgi:hypothetical protein
MAGFAAMGGAAAAWVGGVGRGLAAGLGAAGAASAASLTAFLTERIAFGGAVGAAAARLPLLPASIRERIRDASSSLIELLWLLAATPNFSAASSTSLFSRPRSRDSS